VPSWQERLGGAAGAARNQWTAVRTLGEIGMLKPRVAMASARATSAWGPNSAAGYEMAARVDAHGTALIDEDGHLSFGEIDSLANGLANALCERGIGPGESVAMLCRNGRWFVLVATALARAGATALLLNTGFAGPQTKEVLEREGVRAVVYDREFAEMVESHVGHLDLYVTDTGNDGSPDGSGGESLSRLLASAPRTRPSPPAEPASLIILTSGTTGTPKGARRSSPKGLVAVTGMFSLIPWRTGDVHLVAAPMFHALGGGAVLIASQLVQTIVTRRRFDPEATLADIERHGVTGMTVVPVMLQRILDLPDGVIDKYDTSTLRLVECSGSALPGSLALRWMDRFGDNLYNMFGSTEVAAATVATPTDLRAAPGTAGRIVPGVAVRLYDEGGNPVTEPGQTGSIYVGSALRFDSYTSGDTKDSIDGLLSIGDVGHFDEEGRLFVGGRDDDMIVSGGENVYPREVEDLLADHPDVVEAAVLGVDDERYGQRLVAFVVKRDGSSLTEDDVKAHVKQNLASYKVPRDVSFLDELPRTSTGKIVKRELGS
jgi:fatty-acyl-CoA synthase